MERESGRQCERASCTHLDKTAARHCLLKLNAVSSVQNILKYLSNYIQNKPVASIVHKLSVTIYSFFLAKHASLFKSGRTNVSYI